MFSVQDNGLGIEPQYFDHLRVVAEGVETSQELQFVKDRGCDEGQGCYFSRTLTASAFAEHLARQDTAMAAPQRSGTRPERARKPNARLPAIQ